MQNPTLPIQTRVRLLAAVGAERDAEIEARSIFSKKLLPGEEHTDAMRRHHDIAQEHHNKLMNMQDAFRRTPGGWFSEGAKKRRGMLKQMKQLKKLRDKHVKLRDYHYGQHAVNNPPVGDQHHELPRPGTPNAHQQQQRGLPPTDQQNQTETEEEENETANPPHSRPVPPAATNPAAPQPQTAPQHTPVESPNDEPDDEDTPTPPGTELNEQNGRWMRNIAPEGAYLAARKHANTPLGRAHFNGTPHPGASNQEMADYHKGQSGLQWNMMKARENQAKQERDPARKAQQQAIQNQHHELYGAHMGHFTNYRMAAGRDNVARHRQNQPQPEQQPENADEEATPAPSAAPARQQQPAAVPEDDSNPPAGHTNPQQYHMDRKWHHDDQAAQQNRIGQDRSLPDEQRTAARRKVQYHVNKVDEHQAKLDQLQQKQGTSAVEPNEFSPPADHPEPYNYHNDHANAHILQAREHEKAGRDQSLPRDQQDEAKKLGEYHRGMSHAHMELRDKHPRPNQINTIPPPETNSGQPAAKPAEPAVAPAPPAARGSAIDQHLAAGNTWAGTSPRKRFELAVNEPNHPISQAHFHNRGSIPGITDPQDYQKQQVNYHRKAGNLHRQNGLDTTQPDDKREASLQKADMHDQLMLHHRKIQSGLAKENAAQAPAEPAPAAAPAARSLRRRSAPLQPV